MTFAWYAHLKNLNHKALWIAILVSWGIAFFEYAFQFQQIEFVATNFQQFS